MFRILYAEDESALHKTLAYILELHFPGVQIVECKNYQDAVHNLTTNGPFDFVLSDWHYSGEADRGAINRHGTGGFDLLTYIRENNLDTPIVLFSSVCEQEVERLAKEKGIAPPDLCFRKPVHPKTVIAELKSKFLPGRPIDNREVLTEVALTT